MNDEDAVWDVEQRRCVLINALDLGTLGTLLADDYRHVHANGTVTDKPETLRRIAAQPRHVERGEVSVRVWGDMAILIGEQHSRMTPPDAPEWLMRGIVTQVLRRECQDWLFVSFHLTTLQG